MWFHPYFPFCSLFFVSVFFSPFSLLLSVFLCSSIIYVVSYSIFCGSGDSAECQKDISSCVARNILLHSAGALLQNGQGRRNDETLSEEHSLCIGLQTGFMFLNVLCRSSVVESC